MAIPYNFQCNNPTLAAEIASLRTTDIQTIFKACFSVTVNIMQKFPKPPKCKAAEYIVDNAPEQLLTQHLATNMGDYQAAANNGAGRPVNKYEHDPSHDNNAWRNRDNAQRNSPSTVQVENVPASVTNSSDETVAQIVREANTETVRHDPPTNNSDSTGAADNLAQAIAEIVAGMTPALDENKVREIARQEDAKVSEFIKRTIGEAVAAVAAPTRVVVQYADDNTAVRDMGIQHKEFPMLLQLIQAGYPIWIPGPAGSGKTTAVWKACEALNAKMFTPPEGPIENKYGMVGYETATGDFKVTSLYECITYAVENPEQRVVFFIDECDAAYPNALMVLNAVMENKYCTFANGQRIHFGDNLIFIAGANTYGTGATAQYVGRNKLDDATLDRFITLAWDYDEALERAIVLARHPERDAWVTKVQRIRQVASTMGKYIISPRASLRGARLLDMGIDEDRVLAMTVFKGMTSDTVNSVCARI